MTLKKIIILIVTFLLGFLACASLMGFLIYTHVGAQLTLQQFAQYSLKDSNITWGNLSGNLGVGVNLENIEISNIKQLPLGTRIRIRELMIKDPMRGISKANVTIRNARIILPDSDPIVLEGKYQDGVLDFSIYAKDLDIVQFKKLLNSDFLRPLSVGSLGQIDLKISGSWAEPAVAGKLTVEKLFYQGVLLADAPVDVDLKFQSNKEGYAPEGKIVLQSGKLTRENTQINLEKSTFFFQKSFENPFFFIVGDSKISNIAIHLSLKGTKDQPDLKITSDPPLSQEKLLLILATGKSWSGLDSSIDKKQISPDLAKDFIDYFIFGGSGDRWTKKLGIKNISLNLDKDNKGIGITKELTGHLDVGYAVNQKQATGQSKEIKQSMLGDIKVSDKISINLEKEIRRKEQLQQGTQSKPEDNKVYLKYKTAF